MTNTAFGETLCYQNEPISFYRNQDYDISFFNGFYEFPFEKDSIPKISLDNRDDLIKLRDEKDKIMEELAKSQQNLVKASKLYPNQRWSKMHINKIKQLNAGIKKESDLLNDYQTLIKGINDDKYTNSIRNIKKVNDDIDELVSLNLSNTVFIESKE